MDPGADEDAQRALAALQGLRAGVIVCSREGRVLLHNAAAARILNLPAGEPPKLPPELGSVESLARHTGGSVRPRSIKLQRPAGPVEVGYEVSEGADNTLVLLFQDITEQVRTRTERDRLLQLATVDEVLPTVLHELRNPLAAVTLAVEVLLEECEPRDDPELTEALHTVLAELRRMSLVFQGIGVGGRSLRMTQVAAVDVAVREVARIMDRLAQQSGVTLHVDVQVLPLLPFDPAVVKAIVFNLLSNSIYACHQGGHIKVSLRPRTSSSLLLRVTDDGHGMSADVLSDCTRPFFTTRANGSGLGLVVCREAVEEAGGTLDIRSAPGQGTRVSIELPLTRPLVSIQDSTSRSARRRRLRDTDETDS